ncbi:MAG: hypothetical protein FWG00_02915 [Coriobacteriia bacterium]|nr:hypothetical protein [Coriobacteriia bacterium]
MEVYQSSLFVKIKEIVYGVAGGAVLALILSWFLRWEIALAAGIAVLLLSILFALFFNNIKIVVDGDSFSVHRGSKEKHRFNLSEVGISALIKTTDGDSDCALSVTQANGEMTNIDCSMLGARRFNRLLDTLGVTDPEPEKIKTIMKGSK